MPLITDKKQLLAKDRTQIRVSPEVHTEIKLAAVRRHMDMGAIVEELWRERDVSGLPPLDIDLTDSERTLLEGVLRLARSDAYDNQQLIKTIEIFIKPR